MIHHTLSCLNPKNLIQYEVDTQLCISGLQSSQLTVQISLWTRSTTKYLLIAAQALWEIKYITFAKYLPGFSAHRKIVKRPYSKYPDVSFFTACNEFKFVKAMDRECWKREKNWWRITNCNYGCTFSKEFPYILW